MRASFIFFLPKVWVAGLFLPNSFIFSQNDLVVDSGQVEIISDSVDYDGVTVKDGGVLVIDGILNVAGDVVVERGGRITHSASFLAGMKLKLGGNLRVEEGGTIDVTGKGLRGARKDGPDKIKGLAYDPAGSLVEHEQQQTGGSHGGTGGKSSEAWVYENIERPSLPGSGGGAGGNENGCCAGQGGSGGGVIWIEALTGQLIIEGAILADGQAGDWENPGRSDPGGDTAFFL